MLAIVLNIAFALVAVAIALGFWRLLVGPSAPDRILALDTLAINAIAPTNPIAANRAWLRNTANEEPSSVYEVTIDADRTMTRPRTTSVEVAASRT